VESYREVLAKASARSPMKSVYGPDLFAEVQRFSLLARTIAANEPHDVIDAHDWIAFEAGLGARAVSGRPLVAHIHATEFDRTGGEGNPEIARREHAGLRGADRVISNSLRLKHQCISRYGVPAERIDVVHWGIDGDRPTRAVPARSPIPDGTPVVLFLGRVTHQKGPDYFIEMAGRVSGYVPEARFVIAGNGDMLPGVMERAAELGIAGRVIFAGGLSGEDVDRVYRMASVCVMPSRSEPFGLVALESLLQGTPIILPRDAGAAEVIRHAFKIDCWDIDEMTNKVVAILRHDALRQELREEGRREVALPRFGLDQPARFTRESYVRAVTGSRKGRAA
jgi:glycosyltransferase involved in cell wall biosynthesis